MEHLITPINTGKVKTVFDVDGDAQRVYIRYEDRITAFEGERIDYPENKGSICCLISALLFEMCEKNGIKTHFIALPSLNTMLCRKLTIIQLEVIVRNIAAGSNFNLTTNAATDTLTIESTASGGGTVTVQRNNYTGDGTTTVYGVSSTIASENNIQIYLDGVYQDKDTYTTSVSNVTFSTENPNTTEIQIMHYVAIYGVI